MKEIQRFDTVWSGGRYCRRWKGFGEASIWFLPKVTICMPIRDTAFNFAEVSPKE